MEKRIVLLLCTASVLDHIHKVCKSTSTNIWLRSSFIVEPISMGSFSSGMFIIEAVDDCYLA